MKFSPICGLLAVLLCTALSANAQKTAVILINEQPTRVVLENGEIAQVKGVVPAHMNGYEAAPRDAFQKIPLESIEILNPQSETPVALSLAENVPGTTEAGTTGDTADGSNTATLSKSINFSFESATLSEESLQTIESYAKVLNNRTSKSILLKSWYKDGDARSEELVRNRLDACRQYLETRGVASNIILTSLVGSNRESRFVTVILN